MRFLLFFMKILDLMINLVWLLQGFLPQMESAVVGIRIPALDTCTSPALMSPHRALGRCCVAFFLSGYESAESMQSLPCSH